MVSMTRLRAIRVGCGTMRNHKIDRMPTATARAMCIHSLKRPTFGLLVSGWLLAFSGLLLSGCAQFPSAAITGNEQPVEAEAEDEAQNEEEATAEAIPEPQEEPESDKLFEWNANGRKISHVVIDTNEQRARFYDGREQVGWTTIASGRSSHPTPSGEFEVLEKVAKKRSNLYGRIYNSSGGLHKSNAHSRDPVPAGGKFVGARMPNFMRMTYDGIGMHAGAIPNPGQPASHGCIRLPTEVASSLFSKVDIGTRVTVIGNGPDYGNYAERIRRQRAQEKLNRIAAAEQAAQASEQERAQERPAQRASQRQADASSDSSGARSRSRERDQQRGAPSRATTPSPTPTEADDVASDASSEPAPAQPAPQAEQESTSQPAPESAPEPESQQPQPEPARIETSRAPTPAPAQAAPPAPAPAESTTAPEPPAQPVSPRPPIVEDTAAAEAESGAASERRGGKSSGSGGGNGATAPAPQPTAPRRTPRAAEPEIRSANQDQDQLEDADAGA